MNNIAENKMTEMRRRDCNDQPASPEPAGKVQRLVETWSRFGALLLLAFPLACHASDAIYVGKNLTKDGGVLLAGFGDEPSSHWLSIVPRRQHAAGTTITVGGTPAA